MENREAIAVLRTTIVEHPSPHAQYVWDEAIGMAIAALEKQEVDWNNHVLIDMEMPKNCLYCFAAHYNRMGDFTGCNAVSGKRFAMNDPELGLILKAGNDRESDKRPSWCPLKPFTPPEPQITTNIYDTEEIHHGCTVQILHNSVTGEVSVGWWKEKEDEK